MEKAEDSAATEMPNEFPQYRQLNGIPHFYRIESDRTFTEIQVIGQRRVVHEVAATQFPEMLRIQDMINDTVRYGIITEAEWNRELEMVRI